MEKYNRRYKSENYDLAPITALTLHFLAPNGFEYHHKMHINKNRPVTIEDFEKLLESAVENYGLDLNVESDEDSDQQEDSE